MGRVLSEFSVGEVFRPQGREITAADIDTFAGLTGDRNPVHVDQGVAEPLFGGRIAHGPLFPGLAFGMLSEFDLIDGTVVALRNLAWEFNAPVRIGDRVSLSAEVTAVTPHPDRTDRGRIALKMTFTNQNQETVSTGTATVTVQTDRGETQDG
ncbi:MAG: MaoC/PaaZ C-terminal domain-containing protein [Pseudomonadota bacterium]